MGFQDLLNQVTGAFNNILGLGEGDYYPPDDKQLFTNKIIEGNFRKDLGYSFEVVPPNAGFKEFILQTNPQEITQDEIFAIKVTPTFRGVFVEHQGTTLKDITISGTTGISPKRVEGGAHRHNGRPVFNKGVSGYKHFHDLRNYIRMYVEKKRDNGLLQLWFKNYKDNETLVVEPQKFTMKRSASKPFSYDYQIVLKAIKRVGPDIKRDKGFLAGLDEVLDAADGYMASAVGIIQGGVGFLRRVEQNVENTILGPLRQFNRGIRALREAGSVGELAKRGLLAFSNELDQAKASLEEARKNGFKSLLEEHQAEAQYLSTEREIKEWKPWTRTSLNDLSDKMKEVKDRFYNSIVDQGREPIGSEYDLMNAMKKATMALNLVLQDNKFFYSDYTSSKTDVQDAYNDKVTIDAVVSMKQVIILGGDTIQTIAARELGDVDRFRDIILLNNLKPPYISESGGTKVLKPGDTILIPQAAAGTPAEVFQVIRNKDYPITQQLKEAIKNFGVDIQLTDDFDFAMSNLGDIKLTAGLDNLAQSVVIRLYIEKGSLKRHLNIGTSLSIGEKSAVSADKIRDEVTQSLGSDPRIESIRDVRVERDGDSVLIYAVVMPKYLNQPVALPIVVK